MSKPSQNGRDPSSTVDHEHPIFYSEEATEGNGWIKLPRWLRCLWLEGEITEAERSMLIFIADETLSWDRPCVKASISELARGAGVSRRWAVKVRDRLVERGLLVQHESGQSYAYGLSPPGEDPRRIRMRVEHRLSTTVDE